MHLTQNLFRYYTEVGPMSRPVFDILCHLELSSILNVHMFTEVSNRMGH